MATKATQWHRRGVLLLGTVITLGPASGMTHAALVGAGTSIPNDEFDTAGGRINVDQGSPLTLQPGTYEAKLFNLDAGIAGDVTPFLARLTGSNTYVTLAVGATQAVLLGQDQSLPFGGSATFTLTEATQVFAGIASQTQNPVALDNGTGPNTDHEGGGQPPSSYLVTTVGQTVPPDGSFSNPDLGRTYAFAIDVEPVPEPAFAGVAACAGALFLSRRRR